MVADVKETNVPAQTGFPDEEIVMDTGKLGLTDMVIVLEVAGFPLAQAAFEVSLQVMTSPLSGLYEYTGLLVPTIVPLTFH